MKFKSLLLATALVVAPQFAAAEEATTSVYIGAVSDYVWRGVSQANENPSVYAGVDLTSGPFYVGAWAGSVDWDTAGDTANLETDIYASYKPTLGPVALEFGVLGYLYPQATDLNVWEGKIGASFAAKSGVSVGAALYYSPEVGKDGPSSLYSEATLGVPLPAKVGPFGLGLSGAIGFYDYDDTYEDYTNYKLALTASTEKGWAVEVGYTDTDTTGALYEGRGYIGLKKTF